MTQCSDTSSGFSVMELLIVISIILIIAAIAIPDLLRARIVANQAAAQASLKAIETAEVTYSVTYNHGYTTDLSQLGPSGGAPSANSADLIDSLLASGAKGGYSFVYVPGPVVDGNVDTYTVNAVPSTPCATGAEYYTLEPSHETTVLSKSFHTVTQTDILAEVLVGSLSRSESVCGSTGP